MDTPLRDPSICRGPDGTWYLTATVEPFWGFNQGIKLWKSPDLTNWTALGFVWKYGESPWHKKFLAAKKPLWAPEVHYLKGTFWLTYSMPGWDGTAKTSGSGLLKSTTGKPEGPYIDMQPAERLGDEIDASLFEDDDGAVCFLWHSGKIARLKPDMSGLAEPYHWLKTTSSDPNPKHHSGLCAGIFGKGSFDHVGYEGCSCLSARAVTTSLARSSLMAATVAPSPLQPICSALTGNATRRFLTRATTLSSGTIEASGGPPTSVAMTPPPGKSDPACCPSASTIMAK